MYVLKLKNHKNQCANKNFEVKKTTKSVEINSTNHLANTIFIIIMLEEVMHDIRICIILLL